MEPHLEAEVPRMASIYHSSTCCAQHTPRPHARARAQTCCTGGSKTTEQLVPQGAQAGPDRAGGSRGPHRNVAR